MVEGRLVGGARDISPETMLCFPPKSGGKLERKRI